MFWIFFNVPSFKNVEFLVTMKEITAVFIIRTATSFVIIEACLSVCVSGLSLEHAVFIMRGNEALRSTMTIGVSVVESEYVDNKSVAPVEAVAELAARIKAS